MQSVRSVFSAVAMLLALTVAPVTAQSVEGAVFVPTGGLSTSILPGATTTPQAVSLASAQMLGPLASAVRANSDDRRGTASIAPTPQSDEGGFPWLQVGIGAGVAALFVSAVLTANSGDSAELPRGGISVVLPGS
jgi:hypothetical protein